MIRRKINPAPLSPEQTRLVRINPVLINPAKPARRVKIHSRLRAPSVPDLRRVGQRRPIRSRRQTRLDRAPLLSNS
jgi:hypothetical protein